MLARHDIPFAHWQMKRDPLEGAVWGQIAAEIDDLEQEIRQLILTPKGSVPGNPEKGCNLDQFRDRPMNVRSLLVIDEVRDVLRRFAKRIVVSDINAVATTSQITLQLTWRPTSATEAEFYVTEVPDVL